MTNEQSAIDRLQAENADLRRQLKNVEELRSLCGGLIAYTTHGGVLVKTTDLERSHAIAEIIQAILNGDTP